MDCGRCGLWLDPPHAGDLFYDGDVLVCPDCGSVNVVTVVEEGGLHDDSGEVYVQGWKCAHGVADDADEGCEECDVEDEIERGVVAHG